MAGPVFLGQYSIIDSAGGLLESGRRINRSGIGMSAGSRQLLESFYNNATAMFNQLYTRAENSEAINVTTILALRSKYAHLVNDTIKAQMAEEAAKEDDTVPVSNTNGTNVDTEA